MTGLELAALLKGSLVCHDGDLGEIVHSGKIVHIMFPTCLWGFTILVDTGSKVWQDVISDMEVEE